MKVYLVVVATTKTLRSPIHFLASAHPRPSQRPLAAWNFFFVE